MKETFCVDKDITYRYELKEVTLTKEPAIKSTKKVPPIAIVLLKFKMRKYFSELKKISTNMTGAGININLPVL